MNVTPSGRQLLALRYQAGLTITELADATGVDPMTISGAENGRLIRLDTLAKLAPVLGPGAFGTVLDGARPVLVARIKLGLSRRDAAKQIGIDDSTLGRAERGEHILPATAKRIAVFYELPMSDVIVLPKEQVA